MNQKIKKALSLLLAGLVSGAMLTACAANTPSSSSAAETTAATTTAAPETTTPPAEPVALTISAAASLTDAMAEIAEMYKNAAPNETITYNMGSSGTLQTQIEEGAPADIFMSAAQKQMNALEDKGLLLENSRKDLLVNKVVLITPSGSDKGIASFEDASSDKVAKIALGEPGSVPVGQYSEQVFTFLKTLDAVKAKAVYGTDVRQVLTWVESGEVDCGIVYATDAAISDQVKVAAQAPEGSHDLIVYPVAVLKSSANQDASLAFIDYISTDPVSAVFEKYGFAISK